MAEKDNNALCISLLWVQPVSRYFNVFRDETKLDINYVPHRLPHRDKELRLLAEFFNFALQTPGKMSQRVLIVGDVGTGKTALSQRFGADITNEASKHNINLRYIHVNCREKRGSLFLILQQAVSVFHPNFPKRGYSAEELLESLTQILDEENAYVILTLDEFDSLIEQEGSEAVYKMTRIQEGRQNKPQRLSLICIQRNVAPLQRLDASARSTLQSNIINLEKYSKQQLIDILGDRIQTVFKPQTVPEDTADCIAELAHQENGNARFAIELLWRAGKYANTEDSGIVTPEHVRKAVSSIIPQIRKSDLATLNLHEKIFLLGLARTFKQAAKAHISLAEAEQTYKIVCEEYETKPNSHTQLWKYLQTLTANGIIRTEVLSSGNRGRSTHICLPTTSAAELEKELTTILEK